MPIYTFYNKRTKKSKTEFMPYAEAEAFVKKHPNYSIMPTAPLIGDPARLGRVKVGQDFSDRLKHIKKSHLHSTVRVRD